MADKSKHRDTATPLSADQPIESLRLSLHECDNSEPADADELMSALMAAQSGTDPESARLLMQEMLRRVRSGDRSIMPFVENWIVHAFGKIIEGGYSADQAFGLKAVRGVHERPDTHDRDIVATAMVILAMRSGENWENAIWKAATVLFDHGRGDSAVKTAYTKYKDALNLLPDASLTALIPD